LQRASVSSRSFAMCASTLAHAMFAAGGCACASSPTRGAGDAALAAFALSLWLVPYARVRRGRAGFIEVDRG
jgi:hypothetical protein